MRNISRALVPARRLLSAHLDRLRQTLDSLGQQLRDALARAVAQTVESAVREAVHTALDAPPPDHRLTGHTSWLPRRNPALWEEAADRTLDDRWPDEEDNRAVGQAAEAVRRGTQEGRARCLADPKLDHRARPGVHR